MKERGAGRMHHLAKGSVWPSETRNTQDLNVLPPVGLRLTHIRK